jgi:hypothetical protein
VNGDAFCEILTKFSSVRIFGQLAWYNDFGGILVGKIWFGNGRYPLEKLGKYL